MSSDSETSSTFCPARSACSTAWTGVDATAEDFLYVPKNGVHAFSNDSDQPASMLILSNPGAPGAGDSTVVPT